MADGVDRGGLDYNIKVTGDIDALKKFEETLDRIIAKADKAAKPVATAGGESRRNVNAKAEIKTQQQLTTILNKQSAVERKILSLLNRQQIAKSKQVTQQKVITDKVEQRQKADVSNLKIQQRSTKESIAQSKAEERIARTSLKRLEIEKAIQLARKAGAKTPQQISQETGISTTQLGKSDKNIAAQNKALKEQESLRKRNLEIQKRQATEAQKNRELHQKIVTLARQQNISLSKAAKQLGLSSNRAKALGIELNKVTDFADKFLFTFRRLVGILAIFTLARRFAALIGSAVKEMTRFNSVLEQTQIGFASLIAGAGEMVDASGKLVDGTEEYIKALGLAKTLQTSIRKDALGTVATFEDLLGAFQAGIGPGLSAGLNLDEIEQVTVAMVKAASTLGVEGAQFTEEIRSIIQGTGALRTTRLLQIPGLSKESIRLAKEQGKLFDQIISTLEPFNKATEDITKSWAGLQSQVQDAVSSLLASGSVEYFDSLKAAMEGFINTLIARNEILEGNFGLNEDAVGAVEEISSALSAVIDDFKTLTSFDELFGSLRLNFAAIGEALKLVSDFISPIVVGIGRGLTFMAGLVAATIKLVRLIARVVPKPLVDGFKQILATVTAITTFFITWIVLTKVFNAVLLTARTILASISVLSTAITAIQVIWLDLLTGIKAGMTVIAALQAAIAATVSLTALVIGVIAVLIGVILFKTGVLSKIFDKLNSILDISSDKLKEIKDGVLDSTGAVLGQSEAAKQLEASFGKVEDQVKKLQNTIKAGLLTAGIRGEARQIFTTFAEGYAGAINKVIELDKELDRKRDELSKKQRDRNEEDIRQARRAQLLIKATQVVEDVSREQDIEFIEEIPPTLTAQQKIILKQEEELVILSSQIVRLEDLRTEALRRQATIISEQIRLARQQIDLRRDGIQEINEEFDLRKALVNEEVRNAQEAVRSLALQRVELSRQDELLQKNIANRIEEINKIDEIIEAARQQGIDQEAINDLIKSREQTLKRNNLLTAKEATLIRTMKKDLQDMEAIVINNDWLIAMSEGFKKGAEEFVESADTIAEAFGESMQNALESAVSAASDAIIDIIDPRTEAPSAQEVAGEVLLALADDLINNILNQFLVDLTAGFLGLETSEQALIASQEINTSAIGILTEAVNANTLAISTQTEQQVAEDLTGDVVEGVAQDTVVDEAKDEATSEAVATGLDAVFQNILGTLGGIIAPIIGVMTSLLGAIFGRTASETVATATDVSTTATTVGAIAALIAALIANTAAVILNTTWLIINAAIPGAKGGMVTSKGFARGFNKGGWVNPLNIIPEYSHAHGFAKGGDVKHFPRSSHIPASDTVPAWLTPGEYIIPKMRVRQFGPRFFEQIRRGSITPEMGQKHLASRIQRTRGVYGLAEGGMVGGTSGATQRARTVAGDQETSTMILPVLVADDNSMDEFIAGGRDVFESEVNDTSNTRNQNESNN